MSRFGYFSFLANNKKQCRKQTRAGTQPKTSLQSNCGLLSSGVNKASSALKSSNSAFSSSSSSSTSSAGRWRFAYQGGTSCPTVSLFKWTMQSAASLIKQINPKRYMQSLLVAPYGLQVWGIGEAGPSSNGHTKYELVQMAWDKFHSVCSILLARAWIFKVYDVYLFRPPLPSFPCSLQAAALAFQAAGQLFGQGTEDSSNPKVEKSMIQSLYHRVAVGWARKKALCQWQWLTSQEIRKHLFRPPLPSFPCSLQAAALAFQAAGQLFGQGTEDSSNPKVEKSMIQSSISTPHLLPRKERKLARTCQAELLRIWIFERDTGLSSWIKSCAATSWR